MVIKKSYIKSNILKIIKNLVIKQFPLNYNYTYHTQKYSLDFIINEIFFVLKSGISWMDYNHNCTINHNTLYFHFRRFQKANIFQSAYKIALDRYISVNKLKIQSIDTSFVYNLNGVAKIGRNKYYKNKKCTKISSIVDRNGIPLSICIEAGNFSDANNDFIDKTFKSYLIDINDHIGKYKPKFLGDKMYDSNYIDAKIREANMEPIIDKNVRNTKNPNKLKSKIMSVKNKKIFKKRIKVENQFCWLKKNKRILIREDKMESTYLAFCLMGALKLISNKI